MIENREIKNHNKDNKLSRSRSKEATNKLMAEKN